MVFNRSRFPKMTDLSRVGALQEVTYILTVVVSSIKEMARDRRIATTRH